MTMTPPPREPTDWAQDLGISTEAVQLYQASDVVDLHIDSFIWSRIFSYDLHARHGHGLFGARFYSQVDFPRIIEAELSGATWIITTQPWRTAAGRARAFSRNLERIRAIFAAASDQFCVVRNHREYRAAREAGKHAAFLGIQGGNAIDENLDALDRLIDDWILRVTLVHLTSSKIGTTSSPMRIGGDKGLSDFGRDYVRRLNDKRVLVDLAHISKKGFADAAEVHDASQPLIVTHTGISGVFEHWRNLDDGQLRIVADTGGTIGVMYQSSFLGDAYWGGKAEAIVAHLAHIVDEDHASPGSDWHGAIVTPRDMPTVLELPRLVQLMLDRGWSDERIRKILGGNFLRVVAAIRGG
jgi:membrane dipeptidase